MLGVVTLSGSQLVLTCPALPRRALHPRRHSGRHDAPPATSTTDPLATRSLWLGRDSQRCRRRRSCVSDFRADCWSLLMCPERPESPPVVSGESLAPADFYELRPVPRRGVRQSDRGTHRGSGARCAVRNTPEDLAGPHSIGVSLLPSKPADPRDDISAVAADVDACRPTATPGPGDQARCGTGCSVGECSGDSSASDRRGQCGQKDHHSLSAHD